MKLPNGGRAIIDQRKLVDYALSPDHPVGKHKARLFKAIFGITSYHAMSLQAALADAARDLEAEEVGRNAYGVLYRLTFDFVGPAGNGSIVSGWIIRFDDPMGLPNLVTCFPLADGAKGGEGA